VKHLPLGLRHSFAFPLQTKTSRWEVWWGGILLLIPIWGWIANLGHRVVYTHKMLNNEPPFPSWGNYGALTKHGLITLSGMIVYHVPSTVIFIVASSIDSQMLYILSIILWIIGTILVPGYMTRYCRDYDWRVIFSPIGCMREIYRMGTKYWFAWLIVLLALLCSFVGLLFLGVGFLFSSVWFWQVAAYSFTSASVNAEQ
jgi:Protein of unknown function (DUF4013)